MADTLQLIADSGFEVKRFRAARASHKMIWHMSENGFRYDVDDWELNAQLYEFGPIVVLLLYKEHCIADGGESAQYALTRMKGGTLPTTFGTKTIRGRLGATNRVCNLLHCADTIEGAQREAEEIFGRSPSVLWDTPSLGLSLIKAEISSHLYGEVSFDEDLAWEAIKQRISHAVRSEDKLSVKAAEILLAVEDQNEKRLYALPFLFALIDRLDVYISNKERFLINTRFTYPKSSMPSL